MSDLRHAIARHKQRFDAGRGLMQNYVNPIGKVAGVLFGALALAKGTTAGYSAAAFVERVSGIPYWLAGVLVILYLGIVYAVGWAYRLILAPAEARVNTEEVNPPLREILTATRAIRERIEQGP